MKNLLILSLSLISLNALALSAQTIENCRKLTGVSFALDERPDLGLFFETKTVVDFIVPVSQECHSGRDFTGSVTSSHQELDRAGLYIKCLEMAN